MRKGWLLMACPLLALVAAPAALAWMQVPVADQEGGVARVSMGIHDTGLMAIAYYEYGTYSGSPDPLRYAFCDERCYMSANWEAVKLDNTQIGSVSWLSLKLDRFGNPHIAYQDDTDEDLKYATCSSGCGDAGNWQKTFVDTEGNIGSGASLVLNEEDRPRIVYFDEDDPDTRFAFCDSDCQDADNWDWIVVDLLGGIAPTSMVRHPAGGLRVAYQSRVGNRLRYLWCDGLCEESASWNAVMVETVNDIERLLSMALDSAGNPRVLYKQETGMTLNYAGCNGGCEDPANWATIVIDPVYDYSGKKEGHLALTSADNPRVVYKAYEGGERWLRYLACDGDCFDPAAWGAPVTLATVDYYSYYPTLELDGEDRVFVAAGDAHRDLAVWNDCTDQDGDRTSPDPECESLDCDDDPSDDPAACDTCACGQIPCAACARCRNIWSSDFPGDGIDSNCDGNACFVATACFGSRMEPEVQALRHFRDRVLLRTEPGRRLADLYYGYSPYVVDFLEKHPAMRWAVRLTLWPVVGLAKVSLAFSS